MAVNNKVKNAGRSKKSKNDDFVLMKSDTEIKLEKAQVLLKAKDEIIADLEARLDISYREQEEMLKELKRWTDAFPYAFKQLEEHAGEITSGDITYHIRLIFKIMNHKFGYKPKMEEI
jgi:hypothetical protein